jgi:predicted transcriptional regulator
MASIKEQTASLISRLCEKNQKEVTSRIALSNNILKVLAVATAVFAILALALSSNLCFVIAGATLGILLIDRITLIPFLNATKQRLDTLIADLKNKTPEHQKILVKACIEADWDGKGASTVLLYLALCITIVTILLLTIGICYSLPLLIIIPSLLLANNVAILPIALNHLDNNFSLKCVQNGGPEQGIAALKNQVINAFSRRNSYLIAHKELEDTVTKWFDETKAVDLSEKLMRWFVNEVINQLVHDGVMTKSMDETPTYRLTQNPVSGQQVFKGAINPKEKIRLTTQIFDILRKAKGERVAIAAIAAQCQQSLTLVKGILSSLVAEKGRINKHRTPEEITYSFT